MSFIFLFGVSIFSYVMGIFIEILEEIRSFNSDLEEGDKLMKFFGTLKNFNGGNPIDIQLRQVIEAYFDYRWRNDLNQAVR